MGFLRIAHLGVAVEHLHEASDVIGVGMGGDEEVEVAILLEEYGATASIMADLIASNRIPVPESVATALAYGIKADTQDLGRETSEGDIRAYTYIYAHTYLDVHTYLDTDRHKHAYGDPDAHAYFHPNATKVLATSATELELLSF